MGVGIVAIIPNEKNRTQEELIRKFGCVKMEYRGKKECIPIWKIFEWEGKSYASWYMRPRYVEPERNNPRWEGIRRRLVEVMEYLGAMMTSRLNILRGRIIACNSSALKDRS